MQQVEELVVVLLWPGFSPWPWKLFMLWVLEQKKKKKLRQTPFIFTLFYFFPVFLGPHLWHMEVPKLGVKSELQLPAYTAACGNAGSLNHGARPGIEPASSWASVGFVTYGDTRTPMVGIL